MTVELLAAAAICAGDWGCAASHMAFDAWTMRMPYWKRIPIWGDVYHLVAGLRYLPMVLLAWLAFGNPLEGWMWDDPKITIPESFLWYLGTAVVNSLGWQGLKRLHGKDYWGKPRWWRQMGGWFA